MKRRISLIDVASACTQRAISTLREMLSDPELAGRAQDALDDIETFLGSK
jgi:hypothetical protein